MTTDTLFTTAPDELERLRAENARLIHDIQAPDGYPWEWHCTRKDEELAKLRHALGLLTTLKPDMEIDVLDPLDMAQQIVEYVSQSDDMTTAYLTGFHKRDDEVAHLKTEIERLREETECLAAAMASDGADACGALVVARAEIKRLRGLLREYLASPLDRAPDLDKRASEALGE